MGLILWKQANEIIDFYFLNKTLSLIDLYEEISWLVGMGSCSTWEKRLVLGQQCFPPGVFNLQLALLYTA